MNDLMSVTEFAEKTGRTTSYIRRLIRDGRIEAVKVGNQWCLPADAEIPPDGRVKSGKYRNWRKPKTQEE